ncbi:MAG TPA: hydantoinase B/oxoprolinase family protein, partial [Polyangiaceae bacterium]|nr:hydantoinase B/oxoprolinase family protein [Polyangiaceae bacterium]
HVVAHRAIALRYRGTETAIDIELGSKTAMRSAFGEAHRRQFGYARPEHPIELVAVRVEVRGRLETPSIARSARQPAAKPLRVAHLYVGDRRVAAPVYMREDVSRVSGPALILEETGTLVVDPGFDLEVDEEGLLWLSDRGLPALTPVGVERDPVQLELFHNQFMSIAEQMGRVLERTALSTNIRERLDFSCAVFDDRGGLVANAPHIPVHLGAMEETVKAVIAEHPEMHRGDAFVTNDPARGGSHLPDITVVTPVFADTQRFFVACRGHHADVGGKTPGSMPPDSRTLAEEGVVLRALRAVRGGAIDEALLRSALTNAPFPARDPNQNIADLEAQLAANHLGVRLLEELAARQGPDTVAAYMCHVQDNAAEKVAEAIARLPDGSARFEDALDDGTPITVSIRIDGDRMEIDFAGTGSEVDDNLNAPRAVTVAAVLYVLRLLAAEPIPLASGCLRPVTLRIPARSVLAPGPERAVAGGNVETSQRVVDVLLAALDLCAASQGTMNNLTFGTNEWGYYETLGGGCGASAQGDGASAVHSHMTNTRITDPEVLESRFPVRVIEFAVRRGSGGSGRHRGGDGLVRAIEALAPMTATILSQRRSRAPFGLHGGSPGAAGENELGKRVGARATVELAAGERIVIATPGGGGWGKVNARR